MTIRIINRLAATTGYLLAIACELQVIDSGMVKAYSPSITPGSSLIILLDNSGSMGKCSVQNSEGKCIPNSEIPYRIDVVKDALRHRISQPDLSSTKIGLIEMGNYKSYGLSPDKSCSAVKTLVPAVENNSNRIITALDLVQANDDGVTPTAYALEYTLSKLEEELLLPAKVLLISDGQPNCNKDYLYKHLCRIFDGLSKNKIDLKLDIIGYKANGQDSEFIACANQHPEMVRYWGTASNLTEVIQKISQSLPPISQDTSSNVRYEESNKWWVSILVTFVLASGIIAVGFRKFHPKEKDGNEITFQNILVSWHPEQSKPTSQHSSDMKHQPATPPMPTQTKIFISYSHADAEWLQKLQTHLKPLIRNQTIEAWDDKKIRPGQKWKTEITQVLNNATIAILLVSPNFLASDFIAEEELPPLLKAAEANGLTILWIPISASLVTETDINDYQAAQDPSKPLDSLPIAEQNRILVEICQNIKRISQ